MSPDAPAKALARFLTEREVQTPSGRSTVWQATTVQRMKARWSNQIWLRKVGITPIQIYPGSPWENGYNERFNGILRHEVLNAEWFHSVKQAQVVINTWLKEYNHIRPHHALKMRTSVPETLLEKPQISGSEFGG